MRTKAFLTAASLVFSSPALLAVNLPAPPDDLPQQEQAFLTNACSTLTTQTRVSQLAVKQSKDPEITSFAQRMAAEDEYLNLQLRSMAQQKHIDLPDKIKTQDDELLERLAKLSASNFDKEYLSGTLERQSRAVYLFETAARNTAISDVDSWADRTSPIMKDQLSTLQHIASNAGITGPVISAP